MNTFYISCLVCGLCFNLHAGTEHCQTIYLDEYNNVEVVTDTSFEIHAVVMRPDHKTAKERDDFRWKSEDLWKAEYDPAEFTLVKEFATAPDGGGGHLRQYWTFKACKAGTFKITFKRYNEQFVSEVVVKTNGWFY